MNLYFIKRINIYQSCVNFFEQPSSMVHTLRKVVLTTIYRPKQAPDYPIWDVKAWSLLTPINTRLLFFYNCHVCLTVLIINPRFFFSKRPLTPKIASGIHIETFRRRKMTLRIMNHIKNLINYIWKFWMWLPKSNSRIFHCQGLKRDQMTYRSIARLKLSPKCINRISNVWNK